MKKRFILSLVSMAILASTAVSASIVNPNESSLLDPPIQATANHSHGNYIVLIEARRASQHYLILSPSE